MRDRDFFLQVDDDGTAKLIRELPDDAQFIVCMKVSVPLILPDNALSICSSCGCGIQLRPVANALTIPKVCVDCSVAWIEGQGNPQ
jgi:hypothetical protein